jgi:protein-L-isoaspartate(D-aspartate) O-methyltransferase
MKETQARLGLALRQAGIRNGTILQVMEQTPREFFLDPSLVEFAGHDEALPIECDQTISQPSLVAMMTEQLELAATHKVLEIGTGSGYQTAILAALCRRVYTLDRHRRLSRQAEKRFRELGLSNITAMTGDGYKGWPQQAPFERIIVTASAPDIPEALLAQLKPDGILLMPVARKNGNQNLVKITHKGDNFKVENLADVQFVPLIEGIAPK